jgi:hypothetical protein
MVLKFTHDSFLTKFPNNVCRLKLCFAQMSWAAPMTRSLSSQVRD